MADYGTPESVEVYGGVAPIAVSQPYSVAPGSDWGAAVPVQQAVATQGGWNIGPNGPSWQGVPSDNLGMASGAVYRTRNVANPMTLYREMGYNPNYNMPGSMEAHQRYGIPPVITQSSPYASLAAVYGPGHSVAPLTGYASQFPHVLNGVRQDYLAPMLSLYEIPMYRSSNADALIAAALGRTARGGGGGVARGGGGGGANAGSAMPDMALPPTGLNMDIGPVPQWRVEMDEKGRLIPGSGYRYDQLPYAQANPIFDQLPLPEPLGQPAPIGDVGRQAQPAPVPQTPQTSASPQTVPSAPRLDPQTEWELNQPNLPHYSPDPEIQNLQRQGLVPLEPPVQSQSSYYPVGRFHTLAQLMAATTPSILG